MKGLDEDLGRGLALALASGVAATVAAVQSPFFDGVPPVVVGWFPVDLRYLAAPLLFAGAHLLFAPARWPWPALALPLMALGAATLAHVQGSALLALLTDLPGSDPGERVPLGMALASGASLVLALAAALDRGRARLADEALAAGLPEAQLARLRALSDAQAVRTLGFTAAAYVALVLAAAVGDAWVGASRAPLPELLGAVLAVGVAVLLFPGADRALRRRPA